MIHKSVLLRESIEGLNLQKGDIFLDGTLGGGGHSEEVCKRMGREVKVIGIDLDADAIKRASERIQKTDCDFTAVQESFRNLDKVLDGLKIGKVNKILLDIGLSSNQFEESGRGFSFQKDEPLAMTFKKDLSENDLTAREIVNYWDEENIAQILQSYGEERYARRIARQIVESRGEKPIETTFELAEIVKKATPFYYHHGRIHPATRTFQALRITVNDELRALQEGLQKGFERLEPMGRIAIISFHSLEDRIVKNFFRDKVSEGQAEFINKKPIVPTEEEIGENPRSRSAKLRILIKK
jgi:16S rRNA (cytosine1402-N4)-methyltransferase